MLVGFLIYKYVCKTTPNIYYLGVRETGAVVLMTVTRMSVESGVMQQLTFIKPGVLEWHEAAPPHLKPIRA